MYEMKAYSVRKVKCLRHLPQKHQAYPNITNNINAMFFFFSLRHLCSFLRKYGVVTLQNVDTSN